MDIQGNNKENTIKTIETYNKVASIYSNYNSEKLLQFQLEKFISLLSEKGKVLDLGCGPGRDSAYFKESGLNVVSIDLSDGMIEEAKKLNVDVIKMNMLNMTFKENEFSGIWSMASLQNVSKEDGKKLIKDLHKILNPDGILYIAVKEGEGEGLIFRERYNGQIFHAFYTKEELGNLLKENDFEILESTVSIDEDTKWIEIFAKNIKVKIET